MKLIAIVVVLVLVVGVAASVAVFKGGATGMTAKIGVARAQEVPAESPGEALNNLARLTGDTFIVKQAESRYTKSVEVYEVVLESVNHTSYHQTLSVSDDPDSKDRESYYKVKDWKLATGDTVTFETIHPLDKDSVQGPLAKYLVLKNKR